MQLITILLGGVLLIFGRKLFWLFIAITGFLFGMQLAITMFESNSIFIQLATGLLLGFIGAVIAIFFQHLIFLIAGFYAGAYIAIEIALFSGIIIDNTILLIGGGVIGAILAALFIDWAIIILSCMVGAGAIIESIGADISIKIILYLVLITIGVFIQGNLFKTSGNMVHKK